MRGIRTAALVLVAVALATTACSGTDDSSTTAPADGVDGTAAPSGTAAGAGEAGTNPYGDYTSEVFAGPENWLCRPELDDDPCHGDLDATAIATDGTLTVEEAPDPDPDAPIDCFYVYPTISGDDGANSDLIPGPEERNVVVQQAARLRGVCRVYAPMYRQNTLKSLMGSVESDLSREERAALAYGDVADAWKQYIANDNDGRGVVLIGHSQGTGMLSQLMDEEIDDVPELRDRIVGAYLLGGGVGVPEGEVVGEDFDNIPACTATDEVGCIVSFASFRSTSPPPEGSFFGRPWSGDGVAICTNPAGIDGGLVELHAYLPASADWLGDLAVTTPFVTLPGMLAGECVDDGEFRYLTVEVRGDPSDPRPDDIPGDLTPEWGLHLVDANLVMGDIVAMVQAQRDAYLAG